MQRLGIDQVLIDSRSLKDPAKTIFFALHTATNDGHNFIAELADKGVRLFVVEQVPEGVNAEFIKVPDTRAALQELAAAHRKNLPTTTVVAVIGSRGKTIVKEWMADALSADHSVARSPRSFNSQIGVPLSLLGVSTDNDVAIIEAGVSCAGEMQRLELMIDPDIVVVTCIDDSEHSAGFADYREKCDEKLRMAAHAKAIVYPSSLDEAVERNVPDNVLKVSVEIPKDADWMERDRMIATEALRWFGATLPDETVRNLNTRLDVSDGVNNCMVITDTFTCDIFSLEPSLDFMLRRRTPDRRVTVVLDRLRNATPEQLAELTEHMHIRGVDRVICYAPDKQISVGDFNNDLILLKGETGSPVASLAERLKLRHHETVLEVNLDAVVHNFNHFRAMLKPSTGIVAMVKASGYGAGAYELAKSLQSQGAAYLAVAVVDEGEELRRAGITMPIMALNPKVTNYDSLFSNRLEPEVFSFDMLDEIIAEGTKRGITNYPVHIKFDTGMHRLGFLKKDIENLCRRLKETSVVKVESVFSHLATSDCLDMDDYTLGQLNLFSEICRDMRQELAYAFKRHILNSAGIARFPQWQFEMVRLGISLYGVDTIGVPENRGLRTISTLRSPIISIKRWPEGTSIGYSRRTILKRDSVIATVPVGYADGLDRHLGNGVGKVWVNGTLCPIAGNVCMDACMVDVTDAPNVAVGTSVEFFGENLSVSDVADALGTIPYEVLTSVSPRVKRVYYRE